MKRIVCRQLPQLFLLCVVIFLTGCFSSTVSLHGVGLKKVDHRLTGVWFTSKQFHTQIYLHIVIDHEKNMRLIRVASPVSNRGERIQLDDFYIFPTKINNVYYMNLEFGNQDGDKKAYARKYWFVKYQLTSPTVLKIWALRHSAIVRGIQAGHISGKAWLNGKQKRISLHSTREELVKWLANTKGAVDWGVPQTYKRLNKASYREY
ncbi:hypothetical protein MNBD_GAMMA12-3972 [hydrothermal vent metagenome]|uniref:Lipoprotein n=1 Tax=hydrothermal vent metagenome TaxID=652676 RepID=A0A3B0Y7C2_9ZZZZ